MYSEYTKKHGGTLITQVRQNCQEFEASVGHQMKPCLKEINRAKEKAPV